MEKITPGIFTSVEIMMDMVRKRLSMDKDARAYLLGRDSKMDAFSPEETWALLASVAVRILKMKAEKGAVTAKAEREKAQDLLGIHPADMLHVMDIMECECEKRSFSLTS